MHVGFWGGGLENDLESNKKSWRGEAVKLRNTLLCRVFLGGEVKKMTWNRDKKSWIGEAVKLRNTLACRVLGERY